VIVVPRELRRVPLSLDTLLHLVRGLGADPHPVLVNTPVWRDPDASSAEDRRAVDELRRAGLHDGRRLDPDFADVVDALVRPRRELYGWLTSVEDGGVRRRGLLAVSAHQVGVVLVRLDTDHTVMAVVPPSRVAAAFAGELPDVPAAPGREIVTSYRAYSATPNDGDGFDGFGAADDPPPGRWPTCCAGPGWDRVSCTPRCGTVVYLDTTQGRRIAERRTNGTDDTAALVPADAAAVTERLTRWLDATARGR
jgi:ESX secretion-associated protein EspG